MSSTNNPKKRKVGAASSSCVGEGENGNLAVCDELKTISAHMSSMMELMRNMQGEMNSMKGEMKSMRGDMKNMQGEMVQLTKKCDGMERTIQKTKNTERLLIDDIDHRFDNMHDRFIYNEVLLENQKWVYSAPYPSPDYWDSLVDEVEQPDAESAAKSFLYQIKTITEKMRYGQGQNDIFIASVVFASVVYTTEFLPHWREFCDALEQYEYCLTCSSKGGGSSTLQLSYMELPDTVLDLLSEALKSTYFTRFALQSNRFGQEGIEFALEYLETNHVMKAFHLGENPISEMEQVEQLCQIVEDHPSIEDVTINRGAGREGEADGYEMLQMIMSAGRDKLTTINLSDNNIRTDGDTFISDFLITNTVLQNLSLESNELNDDDAAAIAGALARNKTLRGLDLMGNNIVGWRALSRAVFDRTSLNSAADSNHTCLITRLSIRPSGIEYSTQGESDAKYVRQKKIYSILSSRNRSCSNADHFEDVPVGLLPDMLSSIQQYSNYHDSAPRSDDDVEAVSIVYEILQRWDKSLAVFESLSS